MQVAFSGKSRYGSVYRKAVKGHRMTNEQPEVSKMTLFIGVSRKSFVGGSESVSRVYVFDPGRCTHQKPFRLFSSEFLLCHQA
jgi:hypothetical protein